MLTQVIPVADAPMIPEADARGQGVRLIQGLLGHPTTLLIISSREVQAGHDLLTGLTIAVVEALF